MVVRVRFIYILIIILVSFGTIGQEGCDECFSPTNCEGTGGGQDEDEDDFEYECNGESIPNEIDCCTDSIGTFIGPCSLSEPICCPAGNCTSDYDLCPDVIECPEDAPQPCGPYCIRADDTCCNFEKDKAANACFPFAPICCPEGTGPRCANSFDECCHGTGCI